jgi:lauroyl/myristoyl acyltransferase
MAGGRERNGKRVLWVGGLERGLRQVIAARGVLALMADQHPGPPEECEYLALWDRVRVPYPARLLRFLSGQGFHFIPVSTRLEADGVSRFRYHPAMGDPSPGNIRSFLEESIAAAPEQWNWSYPKITV